MIPKIIHYVWIGDSKKPESVLQYINTWKKYCPEYKIIEWNNSALNNINNKYVSQAVKNKKWAFASDYLRLVALYNYGGFYFDTDIELTNNIDIFLQYRFVTCYEDYKGSVLPILTSFIGATKENYLIRDMIKLYDNIEFEKEDGSFDTTPNTMRIANLFKINNIITPPYKRNETTIIGDGHIIFPYTHFCAHKDGFINYAIHHFDGSWIEAYSRKVKFDFLCFKLVRFKKRKALISERLPLYGKEKVLFTVTFGRKIYAILKNY